jgi:2-polyprenyl-3-methyl-5-hydroxy-6-metoxy-1,4-benzoquinol methylase
MEGYWGEIPRYRMRNLLGRAATIGATRAVVEWATHGRNQYLARYILDWRRALCLELIDLPEEGALLDYGCGYGTLGLSAASACRTVYLADSTFERVAFARLRAEEMHASNVIALAIQDWHQLPIAANSLDVILLNGVLEWVAQGTAGDPLAVQHDFLQRMWTLLKPGGTLYVGIENRYALRYFTGYPDDHSQLRFTSLMPRRLADLYTRWRGRGPYRTLTWSLAEHYCNFAKLRFVSVEAFCMYPDYRFPEAVCRLEDRNALRRLHTTLPASVIKRAVRGIITRLDCWPRFVYSFGIVARKAGPTTDVAP